MNHRVRLLAFFSCALVACSTDKSTGVTPLRIVEPSFSFLQACDNAHIVRLRSDWERAPTPYVFQQPVARRFFVQVLDSGQATRRKVLRTNYWTENARAQLLWSPIWPMFLPDSGLVSATAFNFQSSSFGPEILRVEAEFEMPPGGGNPNNSRRVACGSWTDFTRPVTLTEARLIQQPGPILVNEQSQLPAVRLVSGAATGGDTIPPDSASFSAGSAVSVVRLSREVLGVVPTQVGTFSLTASLLGRTVPVANGVLNVCGSRSSFRSVRVSQASVGTSPNATAFVVVNATNCAWGPGWDGFVSITPASGLLVSRQRSSGETSDRLAVTGGSLGDYWVRVSGTGPSPFFASDSFSVAVRPSPPDLVGSIFGGLRPMLSWGSTMADSYRLYRTTSLSGGVWELVYSGPALTHTDFQQSVSAYRGTLAPAGSWVAYRASSFWNGEEFASSSPVYFSAVRPRF